MEFRFKKCTAINKEKPFQNVKTASFRTENWRFWSGLRDLNPRSLGPKPSAIPNFAKPGYSVGDFSDVVKHVVKGYFRPEQGRSQEEKVLAPQRVFELAGCYRRFGAPAPKPGALPTGPHPDIHKTIVPYINRFSQRSQGKKLPGKALTTRTDTKPAQKRGGKESAPL